MKYDSIQTERLKKLIEYKKTQLAKITSKYYAQVMNEEIRFLEKEILPIVQTETQNQYSEVTKFVVKAYSTAIKYKCNAVLFYLPINEEYETQPILGIVNPKQMAKFGDIGAVQVYVDSIEIINMDNNGVKHKPIALPIYEML